MRGFEIIPLAIGVNFRDQNFHLSNHRHRVQRVLFFHSVKSSASIPATSYVRYLVSTAPNFALDAYRTVAMAPRKMASAAPKLALGTKAPRIAKADAPATVRARTRPPRGLPLRDEEEPIETPHTVSVAQFQRLEASIDERFEQLDVAFQSSYHDLSDSIDGKFAQLLQRLDPQQPHSAHCPPALYSSSGDVLSQWFWLDKSTIEAIDRGNFDINQLPKLLREESLRNRYLTKAADGFRVSLDGSKVELITTRTKLQTAFPNLQLFLSAWQIYVSVRTQYHPEYSSGIASWTERLIYRASIHPWNAVLNYAIAYFQAHQKDAPSYWFRPDSDLITDTIMSSPWPMVSNNLRSLPASSSETSGYGSNICQNWNRSKCKVKETTGHDCLRRHVCNTCLGEDHRALQCPQRQSTGTPT